MADTNPTPVDPATNDPQGQENQEFEAIYDHVNVDEVEVGIDDSPPTTKPPVRTRTRTKKTAEAKPADAQLPGIDDLQGYITATKEKQTSPSKQLLAQDGTELAKMEGVYAIVPHAKGDHKIVYLNDLAPADLQDDPKQRTKGEPYLKNDETIYDVIVNMKKHPSLFNTRGETLDVRVIDKPSELTSQLQAIKS